MNRQLRSRKPLLRAAHAMAASLVLLLTALASPANAQQSTMETLLDVDGTVARGHAEIDALYGRRPGDDAADDAPRPIRYPRGAMLLTNPVIEIDGNTATAHVIWTGVMNPGVGEAPTLYEQGREDTELIKVDGKWLIKRRYISSDSGLPDRFDATWEARGNPLEEQ